MRAGIARAYEVTGWLPPSDFINRFYLLKERHKATLEEKNQNKEYQHKKLRAAFKSIQENMHLLFTYEDLPDQNIPNTTNQIEGLFSHLKERINIHRGLKLHRRKKAIKAFLNTFY